MNKKHTVFIAVMVGLVLFLAGFVYLQERVVQQGDEVILATRPVDPRDLFRGEYVILRYEIERDEQVLDAIQANPDATELYVQLTPGTDGVAEVVTVSSRKPDYTTGMWLKGETSRSSIRFPDLEQYFVPEGAGRPIERIRSGLHVRVSVLNGNGRVVGLLDENLDDIDVYDYRE